MKGLWYWYLISTALVLAAILGSCTNGSVVTDFDHITVLKHTQVDSISYFEPVGCDPLVTGRIIENYQDSTIIASISGERKEFKILGNYPGDSSVLILEDTEDYQYFFAKETLTTGELAIFIESGSTIIVFCDTPHPCHDQNTN